MHEKGPEGFETRNSKLKGNWMCGNFFKHGNRHTCMYKNERKMNKFIKKLWKFREFGAFFDD